MNLLPATRLVCHGCGWEPAEEEALPFRCAHAGGEDDIDHLLARRVDPTRGAADAAAWVGAFRDPEPSPFVRFRRLFHSWQVGRAAGMADEAWIQMARELERKVAAVDGRGFVATPLSQAPELAAAVGLDRSTAVWVKDETGNVSGSHKGRHLMGLALWLGTMAHLGRIDADPSLAIASCGNAALAAAVVARAAGWELEVYVPRWADTGVVERLKSLGAGVVTCHREAGQAGDPCMRRFHEAIAEGRLPFTCQGPDNGLVIEGGQTLAWEMVAELSRLGQSLDRVFVQVGGGAIATAVIRGLEEAVALGALERMPRIHAVQTAASPLRRAYEGVRRLVLEGVASGAPEDETSAERDRDLADRMAGEGLRASVDKALAYAVDHRSEFMWPWETEPRSIATAILDDETYDWLAIVRAMLQTGGWPVVASEESLAEAHRLAGQHTGIPADPTGTAGLAGLLELARAGDLAPVESLAVLLTGVER